MEQSTGILIAVAGVVVLAGVTYFFLQGKKFGMNAKGQPILYTNPLYAGYSPDELKDIANQNTKYQISLG